MLHFFDMPSLVWRVCSRTQHAVGDGGCGSWCICISGVCGNCGLAAALEEGGGPLARIAAQLSKNVFVASHIAVCHCTCTR